MQGGVPPPHCCLHPLQPLPEVYVMVYLCRGVSSLYHLPPWWQTTYSDRSNTYFLLSFYQSSLSRTIHHLSYMFNIKNIVPLYIFFTFLAMRKLLFSRAADPGLTIVWSDLDRIRQKFPNFSSFWWGKYWRKSVCGNFVIHCTMYIIKKTYFINTVCIMCILLQGWIRITFGPDPDPSHCSSPDPDPQYCCSPDPDPQHCRVLSSQCCFLRCINISTY